MAQKTKKVGICRREVIQPEIKDKAGNVIQKEILGELSMSKGDLNTAIKNALRRLWNGSERRIFMEGVRFKRIRNEREVWHVQCNECDRIMWVGDKEYGFKKDGTRRKKPKTVYEIDHLTGSPGFEHMERDLGDWALNLFYGELQVLCRSCHDAKRAA